MISNYETQYMNIIKKVLETGYYDNNRTGIPTYKLPHQIMTIDLQEEFPILTTKQVYWKSAVKEILWIMQKQSNNIHDLDGHIWDEWADETGSIGKAYGYQVKQYHQIDNLIKSLKENPQDRRMMINLWNWQDLPEMNLAPCCFLSMWDVTDGKLNCMLIQRSGDLPLGVPFNTTQYAVLTHLIAQATGLEVGRLTHVINNAHVYENQLEGMKEQLDRYKILKGVNCLHTVSFTRLVGEDKIKEEYNLTEDKIKEVTPIWKCNPKLILNPDIKDFYDFTIDNIQLEDYKHMGAIKMPVAV